MRLGRNLKSSAYEVAAVEPSSEGQRRIESELGWKVVDADTAVRGAAIVVLAVPDTAIGKVAHAIVGKLNPGAMVVVLDAAAPYAGHLPKRHDITYFITHPCHPPIFNDETDMAAKLDRFGGVAAKTGHCLRAHAGAVIRLCQGRGGGRTIWAPVMRSHRLTVEQIALLEPGLAETVVASLLDVMREAMDEVVRRGVPEAAARDFLLGHMNILGAVIFKEQPGSSRTPATRRIQFGKPMLIATTGRRSSKNGRSQKASANNLRGLAA